MDCEFIIFTMHTVQVFVHVNCTNDVVTLAPVCPRSVFEETVAYITKETITFFSNLKMVVQVNSVKLVLSSHPQDLCSIIEITCNRYRKSELVCNWTAPYRVTRVWFTDFDF